MHSLTEPGAEHSLLELADHFLDSPEEPVQQLGLLLALQQENTWFKRNRQQNYLSYTEEERQQIHNNKKKRQSNSNELSKLIIGFNN